MVKHDKIDATTDILSEIFEATQNDLTKTVARGLVQERPLATINKNIRDTGKRSMDLTNKILGSAGKALGISTKDLMRENAKQSKRVIAQYQLKDSAALRKDLYKATIKGIEKQPKVRTKSGQRWGYKEYMEMKVRTTIAKEAGDMQLEFGGEAGVVFYLCNIFQDSADDHADFQGKYYYDDRFKTFGYGDDTLKQIEAFIRSKRMLPIQRVRDGKPYLGTRPNCRHTFTPVSLEQVMNVEPAKLSKEIGTITGTYKDNKYKATQSLRLSERNIRNYAYKADLFNTLALDAKSPEMRAKFIRKAAHYKQYRDKWRKKRRNLVGSNKHLDTDYRRETRKKILQDLGVKYNIDNPAEHIKDIKIIDEQADEIIQNAVETKFVNKSISKTARQERDLEEFAYANVDDMLTNKKLRNEWRPVLKSMANDFPELDGLNKYTIRRTRHRKGTFGIVKPIYDAVELSDSRVATKIELELGFSNPLLKDYDKVKADAVKYFKSGDFSTDDLSGTLVHELAHVIDIELSSNLNGLDAGAFIEKYNGSILDRKTFYKEVDGKILKVFGFDFSRKLFHKYTKSDFNKKSRGLTEVVSEYALKDASEFFAEAFTKWYLSDTPDGEFEQTFGKLFYELREEVKNANTK